MGMQWPKAGPNFVPAYQISGIPFVQEGNASDGVQAEIKFPYVTKFIYIKARGAGTLGVGFSESGLSGSNRITLEDNESVTLDLRTRSLWVQGVSGSAQYELVAGLTSIGYDQYLDYTGSAGFSGIG